MDTQQYREKAIEIIEYYIKGAIGSTEASDWALEVIKSSDFDALAADVKSAVHLILDLHDVGASWCPTRDELNRCVAEMQRARDSDAENG